MCSGVWPGVWTAWTVMLPSSIVSPSYRRVASKPYCQSSPPSPETYICAPVATASSRVPDK